MDGDGAAAGTVVGGVVGVGGVVVGGSFGDGKGEPIETEHDALLALVRKKLRAEFNFPKNKDRYFGVQAAYSLENVKYPQADGSVCGTRPALAADAALKLDCGAGLGAAMALSNTAPITIIRLRSRTQSAG